MERVHCVNQLGMLWPESLVIFVFSNVLFGREAGGLYDFGALAAASCSPFNTLFRQDGNVAIPVPGA